MKTVLTIIPLVIILIGGAGWLFNVYKLATSNFEAPYKNEIIRGIGVVVAPLGAVVGYINMDD